MTTKYHIVIGTLDRTPQVNYLGGTMQSLRRSGLWDSPVTFRLDIVDSGSPHWADYINTQVYENLPAHLQRMLTVHSLDQAELTKARPQFVSEKNGIVRRSRNANALACLEAGLASNSPWVLFLEADIEVCADFLGSVDRWLNEHARRNCHMYSFATPYKAVCSARDAGQTSWAYPVRGFYGNQALAFTRADALSAWTYISKRLPTWDTGQGFDLLLKEWATKVFNAESFMASVPSFAQHMGVESTLHLGRFHQVSAFAGTDWSYAGRTPEVMHE